MGDFKIPEVPNWDKENRISYHDTYLDFTDIENLNKALLEIGLNLKYTNNNLRKYEKQLVKLKAEYNRKYRKTMMSLDITPEAKKKIAAEIECEDLEIKISYLEQIIKEITRLTYSYRTELEILQTIGHNLRREMTL